jgi:hypothetical protein
MYGTTFSGKCWYQELSDCLLEVGFSHSQSVQCLFWKVNADRSTIFPLDYVDDLFYHGTSDKSIHDFEQQLLNRFDLEVMGQAHWYLGCRITQPANYYIVIDQSCCCLSLLQRFSGCANIMRKHATSLALDFIPTADDNSATE